LNRAIVGSFSVSGKFDPPIFAVHSIDLLKYVVIFEIWIYCIWSEFLKIAPYQGNLPRNLTNLFLYFLNIGYYKGFLTVAVGIVPAQGAYITGYELVKSLVEKSPFGNTALANFLGGAAASLASATVGVPLDVISSRLMLQSPSGELTQRHYKGGMNALTSIFANEGIRGLYRGYGASLITYAPTSAVWWLTYGLIRPLFYPFTNKDPIFENIAAGFCGAFSGATAAFVTNPLDVAKTRLQTQRQPTEVPSDAPVQQGVPTTPKLPRNIFSMLRYIGANESIFALWKRGLMARMVSMAINGSILILTYENVKKFSLKPGSLAIKPES
jgi:solute carrier family 25, member 44